MRIVSLKDIVFFYFRLKRLNNRPLTNFMHDFENFNHFRSLLRYLVDFCKIFKISIFTVRCRHGLIFWKNLSHRQKHLICCEIIGQVIKFIDFCQKLSFWAKVTRLIHLVKVELKYYSEIYQNFRIFKKF